MAVVETWVNRSIKGRNCNPRYTVRVIHRISMQKVIKNRVIQRANRAKHGKSVHGAKGLAGTV